MESHILSFSISLVVKSGNSVNRQGYINTVSCFFKLSGNQWVNTATFVTERNNRLFVCVEVLRPCQ